MIKKAGIDFASLRRGADPVLGMSTGAATIFAPAAAS